MPNPWFQWGLASQIPSSAERWLVSMSNSEQPPTGSRSVSRSIVNTAVLGSLSAASTNARNPAIGCGITRAEVLTHLWVVEQVVQRIRVGGFGLAQPDQAALERRTVLFHGEEHSW